MSSVQKELFESPLSNTALCQQNSEQFLVRKPDKVTHLQADFTSQLDGERQAEKMASCKTYPSSMLFKVTFKPVL